MKITFPDGADYETGAVRATWLLKPGRSRGQWVYGERITATYLPGAEGAAMMCVETGRGGNYLKQAGGEFLGGAWPNAVATALVMSPRGEDWLLEVFDAEKAE